MVVRKRAFSVTLDDCVVQTFRAGGPGGQKQNKTESGVRVIHTASGARGESREQRSQLQNKKLAFRRMSETAKFRLWVRQTLDAMDGVPTPEECVEKDMALVNLRVEVQRDGVWHVEEES